MTSKAEALYTRLPAGAQNLALSAVGVRYRWDRLGPGFDDLVLGYREREPWPPEAMHTFVEGRLRELLVNAFRSVPYYRRRWSQEGIAENDLQRFTFADLALLPPTPKDDVRADPQALLSADRGRRGRVLRHSTSGSTGTPTTVFLTVRNLREFNAVREARSYGWARASITMPRATMGARLVAPQAGSRSPVYRYNRTEKQVYLSALHISPANLPSYVEGLNRHRPQVLTGLAHSYFLLAHLMLEAGVQLEYSPRAAILGSEKISAQMRQSIEAAFGTRVYEEYGCVENCVLATECERGGLHLSPDFGIVEVLDEHGHAVPSGHAGRLVCTGLVNQVQPLIRYEIGDLGILSRDRCACGRHHMPLLESIVGRESDALVMRDGRLIATGDEIFSGVAGVVEGQVVQEDFEEFVVKVVVARGYGLEQERQLQEALRRRVGAVKVEVRVVDALERTSSGKFRPVVSRLARPVG